MAGARADSFRTILGGRLTMPLGQERCWLPEVRGRLTAAFVGECDRLAGESCPIHVTLDADAMDAAVAPGVSAPNVDGLAGPEMLECIQAAGASPAVVGFDLVEINPAFDQATKSPTYVSGGNIVGSAAQTCNLSGFNGITGATAQVTLSDTNTIAPGTRLTITNPGTGGGTTAPTTATFSNGTASMVRIPPSSTAATNAGSRSLT